MSGELDYNASRSFQRNDCVIFPGYMSLGFTAGSNNRANLLKLNEIEIGQRTQVLAIEVHYFLPRHHPAEGLWGT